MLTHMRGTGIISHLPRQIYHTATAVYHIALAIYHSKRSPPQDILRRGDESADKIRIGLEQQSDAVDQPTDAKQAAGEEVEDTHTDFALIEFVSTEIAEEQAQEKSDPLIPGTQTNNDRGIGVCVSIGIRVAVVDYNAGLLSMLQLFNLTAAVGTEYSSGVDLLSAMLAKLGVLRSGSIDGIFVHGFSPSLASIFVSVVRLVEIGTTLPAIIGVNLLFVNGNRKYNSCIQSGEET